VDELLGCFPRCGVDTGIAAIADERLTKPDETERILR
jgi:hypothetical protein